MRYPKIAVRFANAQHGWCVYAREGSSLVVTSFYRVAGPFDIREDARRVARDLRSRACVQHDDCRASRALAEACLGARVVFYAAWMKLLREQIERDRREFESEPEGERTR